MSGKKALLIEGARCIGKSTICEEFGKNEYESYLLIDFAKKDKEVEMYFEVKFGKQYKTTSLNNFREKYKERIGESYIIHPRNLIVKDGIICIPPYMTMNI